MGAASSIPCTKPPLQEINGAFAPMSRPKYKAELSIRPVASVT